MQANLLRLPFCGKSEKPAGGRRSNKEMGRVREYLTLEEVESLKNAAKSIGRHRLRDHTMITMAYRHALRVSELIELTWDQIDLTRGSLLVNRKKNGNPSTHLLKGDEMRALRKLKKDNPCARYLFMSERGAPISRDTVHHVVQRAGETAGIPFPVHPHMLRHAKGFSLANKGFDTRAIQDYLGHKNINHTVRYTQLAEHRLRDLAGD